MRKYMFIFVVSTGMVLTSCGSESTTETITDSTSVTVDTALNVVTDSTVTEIKTDTTKK
jgi:uncharacterized protein YcfL